MKDAMLTIFDCDGVLVDSELIALQVLSDMLGEFGTPTSVDACRDAFMGRHADDILRGIEARVGRSLPGQGPLIKERMLARLRRELTPVPGIAAALARLDGPRCVASSSDPPRIRLTLELTGLSGLFGDHIFSGTEVAHGKPAPDLFLHAARTMGAAPADCVVIEDSVLGVQAGVAARMPVIGFTGGAHAYEGFADRLREAGAGTIIAHMDELPAALAAHAAALSPRGRAAHAGGR